MAEELTSSFSETFPILNGYAVKVFLESKDIMKTAQCLHDIITQHSQDCTTDAVALKLRRLVKDYKSKKERKRDFPKLQSLLSAEFTVPSAGKKRCIEVAVPLQDVSNSNTVIDHDQTQNLRGDCEKCPEMRKERKAMCLSLKQKVSALRKQRDSLSKSYNVKRVNFKISRKDESAAKKTKIIRELRRDKLLLERKVKELESLHSYDTFQHQLKKEQRKRRNAEIALSRATAKITNLEHLLQKEANYVKELEEWKQLSEEPQETEEPATKKSYNRSMRLAMYKCLLSNVPVERAGELVIFITNIFKGELLRGAPGPSTVSRMAYELGVISDIQTAEALILSDCTTLAWDATSIDGTHVNEVHIVTSDKTMYLQVGHLPGGTTMDYYNHISQSLRSIAETYALYTSQETADILDRINASITCTLTDRAAVNHCVSAELSLLLNKELIELNCNVHPLDGLATGTRKALLQRDRALGTKSSVFGNDCKVANFIYCISKLRYKAGKGDPTGFKIFLQKCGLSQGVIPRYVGNRLHILFHSAGVIFSMKDSLTTYLRKYCSSSQLRLALLGDFSNSDILTQLRVLGLFGKILTGPWMSKFYKNEDSRRHLEMAPYMVGCLKQLETLQQHPDQLLTMDHNVFGEPLEEDAIHGALTKDPATASFPDIVTTVSSAMLNVLTRQLSAYLEGPLSNPSSEMLHKTSSAPLNNIAAERILGMFDSLSRKAPNATVGFVDGKVKAAMNKTLPYILSKGELVQSQLLKFATARAAVIRKQLNAIRLQNAITARERQVSRAQQRDTTARKKVEKEVKQMLLDKKVDDIVGKVDSSAQEFTGSILKEEIPLNNAFIHVWDVDGEDVTFHGKVNGFQQIRKSCSVLVEYKGSGPSSLPLGEFLTDIIMGDLVPDTGLQ